MALSVLSLSSCQTETTPVHKVIDGLITEVRLVEPEEVRIAEPQTCLYAFKSPHNHGDENFAAVSNKMWATEELQSNAFHFSGNILLIETACDLKSLAELTSYFDLPHTPVKGYELFHIYLEEFVAYRAGELD